jgi:acyl dehydratase
MRIAEADLAPGCRYVPGQGPFEERWRKQLLYAEEAAVGAVAPARSHTLTRTDLVRYAGASGDFNPMHHDEILAQAAGMPSVFGHGMFSAGFLSSALTDYVGEGNLTRYAVRFTKQAWPGDVLVTKIEVKGVRDENGGQVVDLSCDLITDKGVTVISGEASATVSPRQAGKS